MCTKSVDFQVAWYMNICPAFWNLEPSDKNWLTCEMPLRVIWVLENDQELYLSYLLNTLDGSPVL